MGFSLKQMVPMQSRDHHPTSKSIKKTITVVLIPYRYAWCLCTSCITLSIVGIISDFGVHASLRELLGLDDSAKLERLIHRVDAITSNPNSMPRLGHVLVLRIILRLGSIGVGLVTLRLADHIVAAKAILPLLDRKVR